MITRTIPVVFGVTRAQFEVEIRPAEQPVVLKNLVGDWPAVRAARQSDEAAAAYFKGLDKGRKTTVSLLPREALGRYFYTPDMKGFNFNVDQATPSHVLDWLLDHRTDPEAVTIYVQSLATADYMPDFEPQNVMPLLQQSYGPRLWVGNAVRTQTHFDPSYNIACLVAGKRRFTLFPPEQIVNLYPSPFDTAPGGVPISMAGIEEPDFTTYPRLKDALETAQAAELEPGDALFIPYAWWHHVQSQGPFNLLVNYWWNEGVAADVPKPNAALFLALVTMRDLPPAAREVWRRIFDMYVFGDSQASSAHLPSHAQGAFGQMTAEVIGRIRGYIKAALKL